MQKQSKEFNHKDEHNRHNFGTHSGFFPRYSRVLGMRERTGEIIRFLTQSDEIVSVYDFKGRQLKKYIYGNRRKQERLNHL